MSKPFIFVSCGQYTDAEKSLGKSLVQVIKSITGLDAFFAEQVQDLNGLDANILRALRDCAAFITVVHPRGRIVRPNGTSQIRASVWIEQEIAIATYVQRVEQRPLPVIAFIHESVGREGIRDLLHLNPITFAQEADVLAALPELLQPWKSLNSTPQSQLARDLAGLVMEQHRVRVSPGVPNDPAFDFHMRSADERIVRLERTTSNQEVVIPISGIIEIMWQADPVPPIFKLNGRLQWLTAKQSWQFFTQTPTTDVERQFGFFKSVGHQTPRVIEICKFFQGLGYQLHWFNETQLVNQLGKNWEIVYDTDGCYFKVIDGRWNQILAKSMLSQNVSQY
ncbi:MAG TPA: hypothetical protein VGQ12_01070 [Candidatus Angelobacter sp.]|jgi:hypothetical protein|nr:hypothetical protein [Candidatus Angelobacter sp.]